jgi:PAS domain S-box-containing protein
VLSKDAVIVYESESISRILGYSQNERVGKNIFTDPIVHPEDVSAKQEAFHRSVTHPEEIVKSEFRLKHKDGSYRDIEAVYLNLLNNPGSRVWWLLIMM